MTKIEEDDWYVGEETFDNSEKKKATGDYETEEIFRKRMMAPETIRVNWKKAKYGWTKYYDDGLVTLDPKVFFNKRRKKNERK